MSHFQEPSYQIIYQDHDILAVNKPPELLCVPGLSTPRNLFDSVKREFPNIRVVHRLDMATSGLVLFALNHQAQKKLGQLFETRAIHKSYCAVVQGIIQSDLGEIHSPIICDWPNRPKQKIDWIQGKNASTFFKVIRREENTNSTRVQLKPITGRTHQLRIHLLQIGHPILGDRLYRESNTIDPSSRLLLHAESLQFTHPITMADTTLRSEPLF